MTRRTRHQLRCQCCGLLFPAVNSSALYCSNACRQHAFRERRKAPALVAQSTMADDPAELPMAWRQADAEQTAALAPFAYAGQQVRVITDEQGMPWFVAADVCAVLGVGNSRQALTRLDDDEKGVISNDTPGGRQSLSTVNESGLYSLILGSRKPEARAFKRWVTHDVLPAIRRTGSYSTPAAAARSQQLPEGVHVVAATKRRAAELWWQAIELDVHSTLARRFDPTHRTDAGLPERVGYRLHYVAS